MDRRTGRTLFAVVVGALALPAAAHAASHTQVTSVKVFTVDGQTSADVTVAYPDALGRDVSDRAVNRGTVHVIVKDPDGNVLAKPKGSADLPVDVPQASSVQHTYRFALPDRVADAETVQLDVIADAHLDPDGPGPDQSRNDLDTDTTTADVADRITDPPVYVYHRISGEASDRGKFVFDRDSDAPFGRSGGGDHDPPVIADLVRIHAPILQESSLTLDNIPGSGATLSALFDLIDSPAETRVLLAVFDSGWRPDSGAWQSGMNSSKPCGASEGFFCMDSSSGRRITLWGYLRFVPCPSGRCTIPRFPALAGNG